MAKEQNKISSPMEQEQPKISSMSSTKQQFKSQEDFNGKTMNKMQSIFNEHCNVDIVLSAVNDSPKTELEVALEKMGKLEAEKLSMQDCLKEQEEANQRLQQQLQEKKDKEIKKMKEQKAVKMQTELNTVLFHQKVQFEKVDQSSSTEGDLEVVKTALYDLQEQLKQKQQENAAYRTQRDTVQSENERLKRSYNDSKVDKIHQERSQAKIERLQQLLNNLQEEIKRLQETNVVQKLQTTSILRHGQCKKDKQKYDNLPKACKKKEQEVDYLKRRKEVQKVYQGCQNDGDIIDLDEVDELKNQLKNKEELLCYYKSCLYTFADENERLKLSINAYITEQKDLKYSIELSMRDFSKLQDQNKVLRDQINVEQKLTCSHWKEIYKWRKEASKSDEILKKKMALLAKVRSETSQVKYENERVQIQIKKLEKRLEDERAVFKLAVQKCHAAYQAVAAKIN